MRTDPIEAYMGIEVDPPFHRDLHKILATRGFESYVTFGVHDIVCRLPRFGGISEFRKILDDILFTSVKTKPIVTNTTTYIILDHIGRKSEKKPTAFCFVRAGRFQFREIFDNMVKNLYEIDEVLAVSVVIGYYDVICEVRAENLGDLERTVYQVLSTPGVSSSATLICSPSRDNPS